MSITTIAGLTTFSSRVAYEAFLQAAMGDASVNFPMFARVSTTTQRTIKVNDYSGAAGYTTTTNDGVAIPTVALTENGAVTYTQQTYECGVSISRDLMPYLSAALPEHPAAAIPAEMGGLAMMAMQEAITDVITGVFSDTGPDGVSTCNDAHPTGVATWDNLSTTALDYDALTVACDGLLRQRNRAGAIVGSSPKFLLVHGQNYAKGIQLLNSGVTSAALQTNVLGRVAPGLQVLPLIHQSDQQPVDLVVGEAQFGLI